MKSKEEIEQLATNKYGTSIYSIDEVEAFKEGYTQCQEDMIKEIEDLKEQLILKDAAYSELGNKYSRLLFKLNKQD